VPGWHRSLRFAASLSRELQALGHTVRLMPPVYVKPYVKRQKNDATDAEAICETVSRPNIRFDGVGALLRIWRPIPAHALRVVSTAMPRLTMQISFSA
jgi:transposase